jgi:hypothetical protein
MSPYKAGFVCLFASMRRILYQTGADATPVKLGKDRARPLQGKSWTTQLAF